MADLIGIIGPPGSGKTSSMRTLDPKETFIINVANKPLPLRGYRKNYTSFVENRETGNMVNTSESEKIVGVLKYVSIKRLDIKQIIIDDSNYVMAFSNMAKARDKGFDKFVIMATEFYDILKTASDLREDLKVFICAHDENDSNDPLNPKRKFKTVGKLLDKAITVEGLFTYILFTDVIRDEEDHISYKFITNSDGTTTAKSPMGCFDEFYIDNDLQYVVDKINAYNEDE